MNPPRAFDFLGNIAIINFHKEFKQSEHHGRILKRHKTPNQVGLKENLQKRFLLGARKKYAQELMKKNKSITTVLEKSGKVSGRLRKPTLKHLAGKKTKEVLYKENNCVFRFNTDTTYFSPRLSNERKEIASKIKKGEIVLVMFAGVSPFSIVIAKNSQAEKIYSNEINREANKYGQLNIELNKVKDKVELIPGDIKNVVKKIGLSNLQANKKQLIKNSLVNKISSDGRVGGKVNITPNIPNKFDVIVMPRPQLKDSFLKQAFALSKKATRIYYYDFCKIDKTKNILEKIQTEAKIAKKKIKILKTKKAGEIAPYKIRFRVDFQVL